ncbi:hypothetical protein INT43_003358 [Umbelopsis isabellina]|uniref:Signal recognition particle receptor subunit beta n=1 Tax=Mortierella isabellina TaxID=91625 RepID=A0A8H7PQL2_MORIS|nr:hypothetical protein INT43_003358 [Umbelopsis isabellina]
MAVLDNPLAVPALVILVLVFAAIGLTFIFQKKASNSTYLVLGPTDAGKTALFTRLRYNKRTPTITSMKENEAILELVNDDGTPITKKPIQLIDVPGHERLRFRYTDFLPITRGVIFVVDSTTIGRSARSTAEYLYDVLANQHTSKSNIPILVACNKTDLFTALPTSKIQTLLEAEINRLRATKSAAVEQQESSGETMSEYLGYEGQDFKFEHLENDVTLAGCSVENGDLKCVTEWIADLS